MLLNSHHAQCSVLSWVRRETKQREGKGNKKRKEMRRRKGKGEFEGTGMNEDKRPCLPRTSRGEN